MAEASPEGMLGMPRFEVINDAPAIPTQEILEGAAHIQELLHIETHDRTSTTSSHRGNT